METAPHLADILCGKCGELTRIALGLCSAIACPGCKTEIQISDVSVADHNRMVARIEELESELESMKWWHRKCPRTML